MRATNIPDTKRYLNIQNIAIARDGLLEVKETHLFRPTTERIVIPREVAPALLSALHLQLDHPSKHQSEKVFSLHYYALDAKRLIDDLWKACAHCASTKHMPTHSCTETSSKPPTIKFAADVMNRFRQKVLVIREDSSSHTMTSFVSNEQDTHLSINSGIFSSRYSYRHLKH